MVGECYGNYEVVTIKYAQVVTEPCAQTTHCLPANGLCLAMAPPIGFFLGHGHGLGSFNKSCEYKRTMNPLALDFFPRYLDVEVVENA